MKIKKYLIVWVLGLLLTSVLGFFILERQSEEGPFSYIPWQFSQVLSIHIDDDIVWFLEQAPEDIYQWQELLDFADKLNSITAYQWWEQQEEMVNFILFELNEDVSIQKIIEAGQQWGFIQEQPWYEHRNIAGNYYIYWDLSSIEFFQNYEWDMLNQKEKFGSFTNDIQSWKYNVWFFSKADQTQAQQMDFASLAPYLDQLWHSVALWSLSPDKSKGLVSIMFDDLEVSENYNFDSFAGDFITEQTIWFFEIWPIVDLIWVEESQIALLLQMYLPENFEFLWNVLTQTDYQNLAQTLKWNIWLALTQWQNELGVWGRIIFEWDWVYKILNKMLPFANQILSELEFDWQINTFEEEEKFWINFTIPHFMNLALESNLEIYTQQDLTYIDILQPTFEWSKSEKLQYDTSSILAYYLSFSNLFDIVWPLWWFQAIWFSQQQFEFFENKDMYWTLDAKDNQVIFKFNLD